MDATLTVNPQAALLLQRRSARPGSASGFRVDPFPRLPPTLVTRYPDLLAYEQQVARWVDNMNTALNRALATPTTTE